MRQLVYYLLAENGVEHFGDGINLSLSHEINTNIGLTKESKFIWLAQ